MDFGTDLMLKEFIKENRNGCFMNKEEFSVLDIGCGYGVVAVIIKSFYKKADILLCQLIYKLKIIYGLKLSFKVTIRLNTKCSGE